MKRSTVMLIAGVVMGTFLGWYLRRFADIDRCFDHGGRWD